MRVGLTILMAVHGAIHVLGFLKWTGLAAVPQLGGRTLFPLSSGGERLFGLAWLLAALALLGAALLRIVRHDTWWMVALVGVLVSQCLIIVAWTDAKVGTIANALIAVPVILAAAQARFSHAIDAEVRALYARPANPTRVVERGELDRLPIAVQRWLTRAIATVVKWFGGFISIDECGKLMAPLFFEDQVTSLKRSGTFVTATANGFVAKEDDAAISDPTLQDRLWNTSLELCNDGDTRRIATELVQKAQREWKRASLEVPHAEQMV